MSWEQRTVRGCLAAAPVDLLPADSAGAADPDPPFPLQQWTNQSVFVAKKKLVLSTFARDYIRTRFPAVVHFTFSIRYTLRPVKKCSVLEVSSQNENPG